MADLPDTATDSAYRPLSLFALAGFGVSCLFGGVVLLSALMGLVKGSVFFFPNWVLLIAAAGFVLSWCGLSDVRNAEGTKAGQKLAIYGMWISLLCGSGYFAYSYITGLAVAQQALAFFTKLDDESGFLPRLKAGQKDEVELNRAFLLTLPAPDRAGVRPDDKEGLARRFDKPAPEGAPSAMARFRANVLVQALSQAGDQATIEPLGVQDWTYDKRSYQVAYLFRVKTPEATADVLLTARSSEAEAEGQDRKWFVDLTATAQKSYEITVLGKGLKALREHASVPVSHLEKMLRDKTESAQLPEFDKLDATDWSTFSPEQRQVLQPKLKAIFEGKDKTDSWHFKAQRDSIMANGEQDSEGRLTVSVMFAVMFVGSKGQMEGGIDALVFVRTKTAVDPVEIGSGTAVVKMPDWEIRQIKFVRIQQLKK